VDWLHVEIYTFNEGGSVSLKIAVLPEVEVVAATFPNQMTVPVGGHFHVANGHPVFLRIVVKVRGIVGPVCDTGYELLSGRHSSNRCFPVRFVYLQKLEGEDLELKDGEDTRLAVMLSNCFKANDGIRFDAVTLEY